MTINHVVSRLVCVAVLLCAVPVWAAEQERRASLVLSGPPAAVSFPLAYMVATGSLDDVAEHVEFRLWSNPDQLRTQALGGEADFMAMPSNVAANLYNRGGKVQPVNISTWGILWIVSRGDVATGLADFQGQELVVPFRGDMPDLILQTLAETQGLSLREDMTIRYVATPMDAMQLLLARRADHVLLAEPAISMALRRSGSFPTSLVAPELVRSLSLQDEWGRVLDRAPEMPQAGLVAVGEASEDAELIQRVNAAYDAALKACQADPVACGEAVAPQIERLSPQAIADAVEISPLRTVPVAEARAELEFFYQRLFEREPAVMGGKMPDADFYRWPEQR